MKFEYKVFIIFGIFSVSLLLLAGFIRQKNNNIRIDQNTQEVKGVVDYSTYPVVQNIPPNIVFVGKTYEYELAVIDSDTHPANLIARITEGPSWLSVDRLTISGVPSELDKGTIKVVVEVTDGDNSTYKTFYILVVDQDEVK